MHYAELAIVIVLASEEAPVRLLASRSWWRNWA